MLNKLSKQQITNLRQLWTGNVLFDAIRACTSTICKKSQYYSMSAEQIFVEVVLLIDLMKKGTAQWNTLYDDICQDYHLQDNQISPDELHLITSCILSIVFFISQSSDWAKYNAMGEDLMNQVFRNSLLFKEDIYALIDNLEDKEELSNWIDGYLHNNEWWSNQLLEYVQLREDEHITYQFRPNTLQKVFITSKYLPDGRVLNTATLLKKAISIIDSTAPSQLALVMEVANRCDVLKSGATPTNYLRALIELRLIDTLSKEDLRSWATQIGTKKKNMPSNYMQWSGAEQQIARKLQDVFIGK